MSDDDATGEEGFPAGVASFDPTHDAVVLWTVCAGRGRTGWEIAADPDFVEVVGSGVVEGDPDSVAVSVEARGLEAGRTYWYRFAAGGVTSPTGRTRTLPDGDPDRLRVGVTCCARYGQARFEVYRELAAADVDVVVHLGDYIYEDTKADVEGREPDPDHDCISLDDYRRRHLQCRRDPDLQRLHQRHPMIVIWDDHDIADNAHRSGAQNHDDSEQGPWADRLAAAVRAHQEFLPKRLAEDDDPATAWRQLRAGSLVSFLCTETRAHRDAPAGVPGASAASDPARTMLGAAQRSWLSDAMSDPSPTWSVVLSGTVMSELEIDAPDDLGQVLPEKYTVEDGRGINTDQWDGYRAERDVLAAAARRRGGRTVVLSGDIHSAWVIDGPSDDAGPVAVEFTCPPAATTPLGRLLPPGGAEVLSRTVQERLPQVRWMSAEHRGFLVADITPERVHVTYWWVDDSKDGPIVQLGRRWEVLAGALPHRVVDLDEHLEQPSAAQPKRNSARTVATIGAGLTLTIAAIAAIRWWTRARAT